MTKENYLRKKGELPATDLGKMYCFKSDREGVSEIKELLIWSKTTGITYRSDGTKIGKTIPYDRFDYKFKEAPYNASILAGDSLSVDRGCGSGFGDLWSWTWFCSQDKELLEKEKEKELQRVIETYHSVPQDSIVIESAVYSNLTKSLNVELKQTYSLSESEWNALKTIMEVPCEGGTNTGWWQFRDGYQEEFDRSGTLRVKDCQRLFSLGILTDDEMDWNLGFYITDFGKEIYTKGKENYGSKI